MIEQIVATAFAESQYLKDDGQKAVISSIINRLDFGEQLGEIVNDKEKVKEAMEFISGKQTPDHTQSEKLKRMIQMTAGIIRGTIQKEDVDYYMKDEEAQELKKSGLSKNFKENGSFKDSNGTEYKTYNINSKKG